MKAKVLSVEARSQIVEIGHQMNGAGFSKGFTAAAVETAFEFEGVFDLMKMWAVEKDKDGRAEIVADIQDMIDECSQKEKAVGVSIRFDDLDQAGENIRAFKDGLKLIVDKHDGIEALANLTGIPQPSLNRFFASTTMPRRTTLLKIAKVLGLNQSQVTTAWSR